MCLDELRIFQQVENTVRLQTVSQLYFFSLILFVLYCVVLYMLRGRKSGLCSSLYFCTLTFYT